MKPETICRSDCASERLVVLTCMQETEGSQTMLFIPVRDTQDAVAVPTLGLPSDPNDVLEILQAEQAPLGLWLEFAKAYLREGNQDSFLMMLEDGSSPGMPGPHRTLQQQKSPRVLALEPSLK